MMSMMPMMPPPIYPPVSPPMPPPQRSVPPPPKPDNSLSKHVIENSVKKSSTSYTVIIFIIISLGVALISLILSGLITAGFIFGNLEVGGKLFPLGGIYSNSVILTPKEGKIKSNTLTWDLKESYSGKKILIPLITDKSAKSVNKFEFNIPLTDGFSVKIINSDKYSTTFEVDNKSAKIYNFIGGSTTTIPEKTNSSTIQSQYLINILVSKVDNDFIVSIY